MGDYLNRAGAARTWPGIEVAVRIDPDGGSVNVPLEAPLDLPLSIRACKARPKVTAVDTRRTQ